MKKITAGVEGMMCGMCESHINDAVRSAFPSIKKVTSDRKKKQTVIITEDAISEEQLRAVIDPTGYTMTSYALEENARKGLFGW
ncbi:MAG TPA: copper resistance protein CopZ [Erysipelotrichaceae bacterium]|nr:copper resistance protein CopZ [Erysipelotrichaceae bacterium]